MKDRCVCLVQDFGSNGVHVGRYPCTDGPTLFSDTAIARKQGHAVEKLREVVVMDVATATELEERAQEQLTDEARAKLAAFDAIAKMCVAPGTAPDPKNVAEWVSNTAAAAKQDWERFSVVKKTAAHMGWDPGNISLADWIVEMITAKHPSETNMLGFPYIRPSQDDSAVARTAAIKRITNTIAMLTTEVRRYHNDSASFSQTIAALETVLATYLH